MESNGLECGGKWDDLAIEDQRTTAKVYSMVQGRKLPMILL